MTKPRRCMNLDFRDMNRDQVILELKASGLSPKDIGVIMKIYDRMIEKEETKGAGKDE